MNQNSNLLCVACQLSIPNKASICSHCGSSQKKSSSWWKIASILKWIGGFATVISLIAGVIKLNSLVDDLRSKQRTVSHYVLAAQNQFNSGDYQNAQILLKEANRLDPYSEQVRVIQVDFLMMEIRQYYYHFRYTDKLIKLLTPLDSSGVVNYKWQGYRAQNKLKEYFIKNKASESLALAAAISTGSRQATILAHIAWLDILFNHQRSNDEIDTLFTKAINIDPNNSYTHMMASAWLSNPKNKSNTNPNVLSSVLNHFQQSQSLNKKQQLWMRSMQFKILKELKIPEADIEMLKLAVQHSDENLFQSTAEDILERINYFISKDKAHIEWFNKSALLFASFNKKELLPIIKTLGDHASSCHNELKCTPNISNKTKANLYTLLGFLYEEGKNNKLAINAYKQLQKTYINIISIENRSDYHSDEDMEQANNGLQRTLKLSETPFIKSLIVPFLAYSSHSHTLSNGERVTFLYHHKDVINIGDIIFKYNDKNDVTKQFIKQKTREDKKKIIDAREQDILIEQIPANLLVLRNGNLLQIDAKINSSGLSNYILPEEIMLPDTSKQRRLQLYQDWIGLPEQN